MSKEFEEFRARCEQEGLKIDDDLYSKIEKRLNAIPSKSYSLDDPRFKGLRERCERAGLDIDGDTYINIRTGEHYWVNLIRGTVSEVNDHA